MYGPNSSGIVRNSELIFLIAATHNEWSDWDGCCKGN
jgi:hypothetical protein